MTALEKLYADCAYYLSGTDQTISAKDCIEQACEVLFPMHDEALSELHTKCAFHINNWNQLSIEELVQYEDTLVEELCAALGMYYAERSAICL